MAIKFRPVSGEGYWYVTSGNGVNWSWWDGDGTDVARMKAGNMFKSRTEARFMRDRVKALYAEDNRGLFQRLFGW